MTNLKQPQDKVYELIYRNGIHQQIIDTQPSNGFGYLVYQRKQKIREGINPKNLIIQRLKDR